MGARKHDQTGQSIRAYLQGCKEEIWNYFYKQIVLDKQEEWRLRLFVREQIQRLASAVKSCEI